LPNSRAPVGRATGAAKSIIAGARSTAGRAPFDVIHVAQQRVRTPDDVDRPASTFSASPACPLKRIRF
jgi:hypothetical protein